MSNANERSVQIYEKVCEWMDEIEFTYERDDDDLTINFTTGGDDIPMEFTVGVQEKSDMIYMISPLPLTVPDDKKVEAALAIALANYSRLLGSFDFDLSRGKILFKMANCYQGCEFSTDLLNVMLSLGVKIVDDFNDKFLMLVKGMMSLDQFAEFAKEH